MNQNTTAYIPGVCNIGRSEIRLRKAMGWGLLLVTLLSWYYLTNSSHPRFWRLLLFLPATLASLTLLQSALRFCVMFGLAGTFNFGPTTDPKDTVEQAEYRRQDRQQAIKIIVWSVLCGAAVTALALLE